MSSKQEDEKLVQQPQHSPFLPPSKFSQSFSHWTCLAWTKKDHTCTSTSSINCWQPQSSCCCCIGPARHHRHWQAYFQHAWSSHFNFSISWRSHLLLILFPYIVLYYVSVHQISNDFNVIWTFAMTFQLEEEAKNGPDYIMMIIFCGHKYDIMHYEKVYCSMWVEHWTQWSDIASTIWHSLILIWLIR